MCKRELRKVIKRKCKQWCLFYKISCIREIKVSIQLSMVNIINLWAILIFPRRSARVCAARLGNPIEGLHSDF